MKVVLILILALTLMAGNCMPIVAGSVALQSLNNFVDPIADDVGNVLGEIISQLLRNAFLPLFDTEAG